MGVGERESWTTEEFGTSHEGAVGVLLADGSVPDPVFIAMDSSGGGREVSQWSVYDGGDGVVRAPRAAALRALCSCGWSGPSHPLRWEEFGGKDLVVAAGDVADTCAQEWDVHTVEAERPAITVPGPLADLLVRVESEIEKLARTTPLAALRAARRLEVIAVQTASWPALDILRNATAEQTAAALGLNEDAAQNLLARFGRLTRYR
ncbi:hypothetical protein ACH4L5_22270 [Streptomyces sp. NPDC017405]|uniref:hypothetical protein n=1 Tax=unclassified Streptomyces TaxID=2593676 RepID=UPI003796C697